MDFLSPSGYYIVLAAEIGREGWYVRVLDFATWKHRRYEFPTESKARAYADQWRL